MGHFTAHMKEAACTGAFKSALRNLTSAHAELARSVYKILYFSSIKKYNMAFGNRKYFCFKKS